MSLLHLTLSVSGHLSSEIFVKILIKQNMILKTLLWWFCIFLPQEYCWMWDISFYLYASIASKQYCCNSNALCWWMHSTLQNMYQVAAYLSLSHRYFTHVWIGILLYEIICILNSDEFLNINTSSSNRWHSSSWLMVFPSAKINSTYLPLTSGLREQINSVTQRGIGVPILWPSCFP